MGSVQKGGQHQLAVICQKGGTKGGTPPKKDGNCEFHPKRMGIIVEMTSRKLWRTACMSSTSGDSN